MGLRRVQRRRSEESALIWAWGKIREMYRSGPASVAGYRRSTSVQRCHLDKPMFVIVPLAVTLSVVESMCVKYCTCALAVGMIMVLSAER